MLPPGSRSSELKPLLRFYTPARHGSNVDPSTNFLASPWDNVFSAGTKISFGLDLAQSILRRDKIRHGTILLLSDLETAGEDQPALARSLLRIKRDPRVRLKLVPLFPLRADKRFFSGFVRRDDFVKPSQLQPTGGFGARHSVLGRTPWPLLVVIGLLLVALAANEVLCARLHVPVRERRAT
jgi:hypothetical protein